MSALRVFLEGWRSGAGASIPSRGNVAFLTPPKGGWLRGGGRLEGADRARPRPEVVFHLDRGNGAGARQCLATTRR